MERRAPVVLCLHLSFLALTTVRFWTHLLPCVYKNRGFKWRHDLFKVVWQMRATDAMKTQAVWIWMLNICLRFHISLPSQILYKCTQQIDGKFQQCSQEGEMVVTLEKEVWVDGDEVPTCKAWRERASLGCHTWFLSLLIQGSIYAISSLPQTIQKKHEYM